MIDVSDEVEKAITGGSFSSSYVADLVVDGQVKLRDVPVPAQLQQDGTAKILTQGTATFTYSDDIGSNILPKDITDWLSPIASFLDISYQITVGDFSAKVFKGRLKIRGVSDPQSRLVKFQDRVLTVGQSVNLKLADLFYVTQGERFLAPTTPSDLSSVWGEIGRLTGLPLARTVDDVEIPRATTFKDSKLDAVFDLAELLHGEPFVNANGAVAVAPDVWGDPVATLKMGAGGTIVRADPDDMSDEQVYNQVVVRSFDDQQATVLGHAEVPPPGPLRYGGPLGQKPYFQSSKFVTTEEQAQQWADETLPQVSRLPAVTYTVQCAPDPRLEVWDVITFDTIDDSPTGRIQQITLPGRGLMTLKVLVDRS